MLKCVCEQGANRISELVVQDNSKRSWWCADRRWAGEAYAAIWFTEFDTSAQPTWLHCSVDWVWDSFLLQALFLLWQFFCHPSVVLVIPVKDAAFWNLGFFQLILHCFIMNSDLSVIMFCKFWTFYVFCFFIAIWELSVSCNCRKVIKNTKNSPHTHTLVAFHSRCMAVWLCYTFARRSALATHHWENPLQVMCAGLPLSQCFSLSYLQDAIHSIASITTHHHFQTGHSCDQTLYYWRLCFCCRWTSCLEQPSRGSPLPADLCLFKRVLKTHLFKLSVHWMTCLTPACFNLHSSDFILLLK